MGQKKNWDTGIWDNFAKNTCNFQIYSLYLPAEYVLLLKCIVMKKQMMILMCMMSMTVFAQAKLPVQVVTLLF